MLPVSVAVFPWCWALSPQLCEWQVHVLPLSSDPHICSLFMWNLVYLWAFSFFSFWQSWGLIYSLLHTRQVVYLWAAASAEMFCYRLMSGYKNDGTVNGWAEFLFGAFCQSNMEVCCPSLSTLNFLFGTWSKDTALSLDFLVLVLFWTLVCWQKYQASELGMY